MDTKNILNLSNRIALITGSTRGIGFETARLFAANGARVIIHGRNRESAEKSAEVLKKEGFSTIDAIGADLSEPGSATEMMREIEQTYQRLDILINNAVMRSFPDDEIHDSQIVQKAIQTNILSLLSLSQEAAPLMRKKGRGTIINVSSASAIFPREFQGMAYVVSKGAIISLTRYLAVYLASSGIRANAITPTRIATYKDNRYDDRVKKRSPFGRMGAPEEVAQVCLFLASDMSMALTGEVIAIGGMESSAVDF